MHGRTIPDLNTLRAFAAVANQQSFSAAAKRLGVPKSSVSRAVAALEADLGVRLFHRSTRRVSLSTAGSALWGRVVSPLSELDQAVVSLAELEEAPSGRLRVTAAVDFGAAVLAKMVARFSALYPAVVLDLSLSNRVVDLVEEGFDVGLRISHRPLRDSSLMAKRLGALLLRLYASPEYLARRGTPRSPEDLNAHDCVMFRELGSLKLFEPGGVSVSLKPSSRILCDEMSFAREVAREGAGVCLLPTFLAEPDVSTGALVAVLPKFQVPSGTLWFVTPSATHVPRKVQAFHAFVRERLRAHPLDVG